MGVDRFLDEQRYGKERYLESLTHVVVNLASTEVFGPYLRGKAIRVRRKMLAHNEHRTEDVVVRKMRKDPR